MQMEIFNDDTFILYSRALYFENWEEIRDLVKNHGTTYVNALLYTSILNNDKSYVENLLKVGADANFRLSDGDAMLHKAAVHCSPIILHLLLNHGADPWSTNDNDEYPCYLADLGGCEENASMLRKEMNLMNTTALSSMTNEHQ
jgi:ankyrin repeat protein